MIATLPDPDLFLSFYAIKEALLSSQIEGTQSSLSDILLSERNKKMSSSDIQEVFNYNTAMSFGLEEIKKERPVSSNLLCEMHGILLSGARGSTKQPGEFRQVQNWIGGDFPANATFVPPPHNLVGDLMSDLEKFIHNDESIPFLIKLGLVHVQFETIHPFRDGNGRLGRLLITLLLCSEDVIPSPHLYLSLHFKMHRSKYYDLLQKVRIEGAWEEWLEFFLSGVRDTSSQANSTARRVMELFEKDRQKISSIGRSASSALRLHEYMQKNPYMRPPAAAAEIGMTQLTIRKAALRLSELGILERVVLSSHAHIYAYHSYLSILSEGAEPLSP